MLFKSSVLLALLSAVAALRIETPASLVTCQPASLTFGDGTAPYYLSVLPGGKPSATPLKQFGEQQSSPYTWTVDIAEGTSITLSVTDSTGAIAYSSPATIQGGSDSSCVNSSSGSSGSASGSAASTSGGSSATGGAGAGGASASGAATSGGASGAASTGGAATSGAASGGSGSATSGGSAGSATSGGSASQTSSSSGGSSAASASASGAAGLSKDSHKALLGLAGVAAVLAF